MGYRKYHREGEMSTAADTPQPIVTSGETPEVGNHQRDTIHSTQAQQNIPSIKDFKDRDASQVQKRLQYQQRPMRVIAMGITKMVRIGRTRGTQTSSPNMSGRVWGSSHTAEEISRLKQKLERKKPQNWKREMTRWMTIIHNIVILRQKRKKRNKFL